MFHTIVASKREMTSRKRLENQSLLLLALLLLLAAHSCASVTIDDRRRRRKNGHPLAREIRVANKAGAKFDFYWIHPETRVLAGSNTDGEGVPYGGESAVSSFVGHAFEVQELEPCKRQLCRKGYFKVNGNEDQSTLWEYERLICAVFDMDSLLISDTLSVTLHATRTRSLHRRQRFFGHR